MSYATSSWDGERGSYGPEHVALRQQVRRFLTREMEANGNRWEEEGITERAYWLRCGEQGLFSSQVPE